MGESISHGVPHIYICCVLRWAFLYDLGWPQVWESLSATPPVAGISHMSPARLCLPRLFQQHVKSSQKQFTEAVRSHLTGSNSGQHKQTHWILSFSFQPVFCQDYWHGSRVTSTQTTKPNRYKPCNSLMYTQTCTWLLWEEPHLPSTTGCLSGCASEACK